jgi:hypothetical protein
MENANGPEIAVESTAAMAEADDKSKMWVMPQRRTFPSNN